MASQEGECFQMKFLRAKFQIVFKLQAGKHVLLRNKVCEYSFHSFAEVVVTSEESLKILLEKIPDCELNGDRVDCRFATRQNLGVFEDIANKRKL